MQQFLLTAGSQTVVAGTDFHFLLMTLVALLPKEIADPYPVQIDLNYHWLENRHPLGNYLDRADCSSRDLEPFQTDLAHQHLPATAENLVNRYQTFGQLNLPHLDYSAVYSAVNPLRYCQKHPCYQMFFLFYFHPHESHPLTLLREVVAQEQNHQLLTAANLFESHLVGLDDYRQQHRDIPELDQAQLPTDAEPVTNHRYTHHFGSCSAD